MMHETDIIAEKRYLVAAIILAGLCSHYENNIPSAHVNDAVKLADSLMKKLIDTNCA
ncbi:MAG: hypothetical protein MJZ09_02710 [Bacteroidales bacterium]|nr:hypothetical protein [Bacteroidales bacterium]